MPIYNYKCAKDNCRIEFEKNVSIANRDCFANTGPCPKCNFPVSERVIAFSGLVWAPTVGGMR